MTGIIHWIHVFSLRNHHFSALADGKEKGVVSIYVSQKTKGGEDYGDRDSSL